jgi:transposase
MDSETGHDLPEVKPATMATVASMDAPEAPVIRQTQWGAIREMRARGVPKKEIARQLGIDIKTVRKWLKRAWRQRQREAADRELDEHREFLKGRAPEVGFNGKVLERELRAKGWTGHYATLARYVAPLRKAWRGEAEPVVRFETGPGEQAQVDWGSTAVWIAGVLVRIHVFVMVLGYSRRLFARAYLGEGLGALLDAHEKAFAHFEGRRCERLLYDNPRTIVLAKNEETGWVKWHPDFKDRMDFYGVAIKLCRYYRAKTKGKVEAGVKYVKRNALKGQRFVSLDAANDYLRQWCLTVADQRIHGTTHERPAERFERERDALVAVDLRPVPPRERVVTRIVTRDAFVAVDTNQYPVPFEWAGQEATVRVLFEEIVVHGPGEQVVRHPLLDGRYQVARWGGPPRSLPTRPRAQPEAPPRFSPDDEERLGHVEIRPLQIYESLVEVGP